MGTNLIKSVINKDIIKYILIALCIYLFFTQLKKILQIFGLSPKKTDKDKVEELLETAETISTPALNVWSETTTKNVADKLYNAMAGMGTDEQVLKYVLNQLEETPIINTVNVFQAFGNKRYFMGSKSLFFGSDMNLSEWLNNELGSMDKSLLNGWNVQLRKAGVV